MMRHLRREGIIVGRHRIRRLMRLMGMEAVYRRPRTSVASPEHRIFPYLLRALAISRTDRRPDGSSGRGSTSTTRCARTRRWAGGHRARPIAKARSCGEDDPARRHRSSPSPTWCRADPSCGRPEWIETTKSPRESTLTPSAAATSTRFGPYCNTSARSSGPSRRRTPTTPTTGRSCTRRSLFACGSGGRSIRPEVRWVDGSTGLRTVCVYSLHKAQAAREEAAERHATEVLALDEAEAVLEDPSSLMDRKGIHGPAPTRPRPAAAEAGTYRHLDPREGIQHSGDVPDAGGP